MGNKDAGTKISTRLALECVFLAAVTAYVIYHIQSIVAYSFVTRNHYFIIFTILAFVCAALLVILQGPRLVLQKLRDNSVYVFFVLYLVFNSLALSGDSNPLRFWNYSLVLLCAVFFICLVHPVQRRSWRWLGCLAAFAIMAYFLFCCIIIQTDGQPFFRLNMGFRISNGSITKINPNSIAASIMPMLVAVVASGLSEKNKQIRIFYAFSVLSGGWIIGATSSMAAWLGFSAMIATAVGLTFFGKVQATWQWAAIILGAAISGVILGIVSCQPVSDVTVIKHGTTAVRTSIWYEFYKLALLEPVFGHGFFASFSVTVESSRGKMTVYRLAHSYPVHVFAQGGVVGLLILLITMVKLSLNAMKSALSGVTYPLLLIVSVSGMFLFHKGQLLSHLAEFNAIALYPLAVVLLANSYTPQTSPI